jgi:ubiquinone/menaquinone biosynthesis C-methylase UbiE
MIKSPILTQQQISHAYDDTYTNSDRLRDTDGLYRWIINKLNPTPGLRLLDIACGLGILVFYAKDRGVNAYGIDLSSKAVQLAKKNLDNQGLFVGNGEALPFPNSSFDYVTNIGSLEHFTSMETGLQEMRRILKKEGKAAIFLPNSYYIVDIFWKVLRTGYSISHRQIIERFATHNEWKDFLESNGFYIESSYKYNHLFPLSLADWKWYLSHPKRLFLTLVSPFIPKNLSYHFLYICRISN